MKITLFVGDYAYSSWSLRGWLLLDAFGVAFEHQMAHLRSPAFEMLLEEMAPSRLVPAIRIERAGERPLTVWDSVALAETVAELVPDAGLWPADLAARATARALVGEMHSGFTALRTACPMNMRRRYAGFVVSDEVRVDLERLGVLWAHARGYRDGAGPFLFGEFSAADAFFVPVASRIRTYDLPVSEADAAYVEALLAHPSTLRWHAMALADGYVQDRYEFDLPERAA